MQFSFTSKEILKKLDDFVIGQEDAKKIVCRAFRDRYRRMAVQDEVLRDEITPKNVLLIGPTGVGKTEIVKRASQICSFPFVKVEATKFTEIGYVGKDAESIIRDLTEQTVGKYKADAKKECMKVSRVKALAYVLVKLYNKEDVISPEDKARIEKQLFTGELDNVKIQIEVKDEQQNNFMQDFDIPGMPANLQMGMISIGDLFKTTDVKKKKATKAVKDAIEILTQEYAEDLINEKEIANKAIKDIQQNGVVFIDEIDKIISSKDGLQRGEVSREGVQRDLLPIIEGSMVQTKYGYIDTKHILFIGCGAFYSVKPSDLLPELQGRFPVRANLNSLSTKDFINILTKTHNNLLKQYKALMLVDNVDLDFTKDGIEEMATIANELNTNIENIGARRLYTIVEKVIEEISFEYPKEELGNKKTVRKKNNTETKLIKISIDKEYVQKRLKSLTNSKSEYFKFIL